MVAVRCRPFNKRFEMTRPHSTWLIMETEPGTAGTARSSSAVSACSREATACGCSSDTEHRQTIAHQR